MGKEREAFFAILATLLAWPLFLSSCRGGGEMVKGGGDQREGGEGGRGVSLSTVVYTSKTMPFSIPRPSEWDVINTGGLIKAYFDGGDMKTIKVSFEPFPERSKNGRDAVDRLIKRISGIMDDYREVEGRWERFKERDTYTQTISWKEKYGLMKARRIYTPVEKNIYVVSAEARSSDFESYLELFDRCMRGFEIY